MLSSIERQLDFMQQGVHLGHFYQNRAEQIGVLVPFLRKGLSRGEQCVYIADEDELEETTEALETGLGVRSGRKKGKLAIWTEREYRHAGEFEPARMAEVVRQMRDDAVRSGFDGLRLAVEMTWAPDTGVKPVELNAWEMVADTLFGEGCRLIAVCQYDWLRFHPEVIVGVLRSHENIILGDEWCPNPYYESPDAVVTAESQRQVAEWMIHQLGRLRAAELERAKMARKQTTRAAAIEELSKRALEGVDLTVLMNETVAQLSFALDVELAKVLELQPDGQSLRLKAGVGWKRAVVGRTRVGTQANSQAGYTLRTGNPVVVQDFANERRFRTPRLLRDQGVVSGMSVVIPGSVRPFGILGAFSIHLRRFSHEEVDFLQTVAHVLAEAIERKRAEEAVEAAERKYHDIFTHSQQGIFQLTEEGRFLAVNPTLARMFGYDSPEEFVRNVTDIERQLHVEPGRRYGAASGFEARMRRKDGEVVWVMENSREVRDESGKLLYYEGTLQDVTERKHAENSLRRLSVQLLHTQEEERRRLARELHDGAAQNLGALALHLDGLKSSGALGPELDQAISKGRALVEHSLQEIRTLSFLLHPPSLEKFGLVSALRSHVRGLSERSSIRVDLEVPEDMPRLAADIELVLYRVVQESLTNVHRHSGSPTARVHLLIDEEAVKVEVTDWGHGMIDKPRGVGMVGMKERLEELGGTFVVRSGSSGTTVQAAIPLATPESEERKA